jgi:hypothetical protein
MNHEKFNTAIKVIYVILIFSILIPIIVLRTNHTPVIELCALSEMIAGFWSYKLIRRGYRAKFYDIDTIQ